VNGTLYGCDTWSTTLRKDDRLRDFENGLMKRKNEVREDSRKLHSIPAEVHGLHPSQYIIRVIKKRRIKFTGQITHIGEGRGALGGLVG
jgi:hypothetical protein